MRDLEQYYKYPSLEYLYTNLEENDRKAQQKRADTFVCKLNFYLKRLKKCNLAKETKGMMYLLLRREFQRRLNDIKVLNQDEKNSLNGFLIGKTKDMRKALGIIVK